MYKFIIFLFFFRIIVFSQNNEKLRLISMKHIEHQFDGYNQDISFEYNLNGKISKIIIKSPKFELCTEYFYKDGKIISSYTKNSNIGLSSKSHFSYENGKLTKERLQGINPNIDTLNFIKIAEIKYEYLKGKILINRINNIKSYLNTKDTIFTNEKGEFLNRKYSNQKNNEIIYDSKKNPQNLVFPEYLQGHINLTSGNEIKVGKDNIHKYEYNEFEFPIKDEEYKLGKLIRTTIYEYQK